MIGEEDKEWNSLPWAWEGWQYSWPNYWYIDMILGYFLYIALGNSAKLYDGLHLQ